jgi:hypothetical protein
MQNDFVTWMMDLAEGKNREINDITTRILLLNFTGPPMAVTSHSYIY